MSISDHIFIFNTRDFFNFYKSDTSLFFSDQLTERESISIYFHSDDGMNFNSPLKGSFGGFFIRDNVNLINLNNFTKNVVNELINKGASSISITTAPQIYSDKLFNLQLLTLHQNNFKILATETNQHILINKEDNFSRGQIRKIAKSRAYGLSFKKVNIDYISNVYSVIKENRLSRGYPVTMELHDLIKITENFTNLIELFGVYDGERIVASAICYRINSDILYIFYWGHNEEYNTFSPISMLCQGIYYWAYDLGFKILDLGTSSVNGILNNTLFEFKSHLGAQSSVKLKFKLITHD